MEGREGVALVVPSGFSAYARVLHPLPDGAAWADVAPAYLRRTRERYDYPFPEPVPMVEGNLGAAAVDALVELLGAATTTPERCHFALWEGWGWLHPGSHTPQGDTDPLVYDLVARCPVRPWWGGRGMLLLDGPLDAVAAIGALPPGWPDLLRQSPQWWWPEDRAWFVGTEIDYPWTYVGGPPTLVDALTRDRRLDVVAVEHADPW